MQTFLGIHEDLLQEILKQRLSHFRTGLVIESLNSIFLRQPILALISLLKGIGNVRYIHCIILSFNYEESEVLRQTMEQEVDAAAIREKTAKLDMYSEMDVDEIAKLPFVDYALYKEEVVNKRKLESLERKEALK